MVIIHTSIHNRSREEWIDQGLSLKAKAFVARIGKRAYAGLSPVTTDNASCFDGTQLSINKSATDLVLYAFSEVAVLLESRNSHRDC